MWHYVSKVSHYLNTCRTESILINIQIFTLSLIFQHRDGSSSQNLSLWMTRYRIHVGGIIHYSDVIMGATASQITSLLIVYSTVYSGADQRKHQNSASLDFERGIHRWPVNSPHKGPVTRKMFPFDDVKFDERPRDFYAALTNANWFMTKRYLLLLSRSLKRGMYFMPDFTMLLVIIESITKSVTKLSAVCWNSITDAQYN